jgi:VanZ family protein
VSVESTYLPQRPKLRFAWLWWVVGYVLVVLTVNESLVTDPAALPIVTNDKVVHFTGYFLLASWFGGVARPRRYWLVALGLLILGGGIEIAQGIMHNGRDAEWLDMLANTLGVTAGLGLAALGLGMWMVWVERLLRLQK